jgi:hypothetical protein
MRTAVAALVILLGLSACFQQPDEWVQARDDAINLKSAIFWCKKVKRQKYSENRYGDAGNKRKKTVTLNEKCMNERGWRKK